MGQIKVWCVKHRDGWCAVEGNRKPEAGVTTVPTVCLYWVTLPFGFERRAPTCPFCRQYFKGAAGSRERQTMSIVTISAAAR